jgi:asparagine synthase (glutamine-hydrolysing)
MTALAGLWRYHGGPDTAADCSRMLSAQAMYGPDAVGQWSDGDIALGRQLMRLLPEDTFDRQPLHGAAGRFVLAADLRLDNREDLIATLQIPSVRAGKLCDADILLAGIERWGESVIERLIGDYAIVVWDKQHRRLLLARDPLGQRPLHFHQGNGYFAFSTMPKGLHALTSIPYELDEDVITESLLSIPPEGARTHFRGVERVLPGHVVAVTPDGIKMRRHWDPVIRPLKLPRAEEYSEALRAHLDEAVRCRLRGANEIGVELSGGLDSSAVAATAARVLGPAGGRVVAFTAVPREGYEGPVPRNRFLEEAAYAAKTAALYPNMDHVLVRSEGKSPLDVLDRNFILYEAPTVALCNAVWGSEILGQARQRRLTVLLNGNTGNIGLSYDGRELLAELFRGGRWFRLLREMRAIISKGGLRWRGAMLQAFGPWCPVPIWILLHRMVSARSLEPGFYSPVSPRRIAELDLKRRAKKRDHDLHYRPWKDGPAKRLSILKASDLGYGNKGVLGGWRIDCRDPTSDVRLLEFCLSVPTEQFLQDGVQRALARRTFADRLPAVVVEESRRGLQTADWHETLTADRERIAVELERLASCTPAARTLDLPRLKELVDNWPREGWERAEIISCYRLALTSALATGHFIRRATGSNA